MSGIARRAQGTRLISIRRFGELLESEDRLRLQAELLEQVEAAIVAIDVEGRITQFNRHAEVLGGYRREEVLGRHLGEVVSGTRERRVFDGIFRRALAGEPVEEEVELRDRHGRPWTAFVRASPWRDRMGRTAGVVGMAVDVTESRRQRVELEQRTTQQAIVAALGQRALEGVGLPRLFDEAAGVVAETLAADYAGILELGEDRHALEFRGSYGLPQSTLRRRIPAGANSHAGYTMQVGEPVVIEDLASEQRFEPSAAMVELGITSGAAVVIGGSRVPFGVLGVYSEQPRACSESDLPFLVAVANVLADAVDRWNVEEETRHRAAHDPLTGLPNRTLLADRVEQGLARCRREGGHVAVLFLDVDHFKIVNDSLGHQAGDELLEAIAPRLAHALRPADTVARFGGDEFVVLCENVADERAAEAVAHRVSTTFERPFTLAGGELHVSASIGIVVSRTEAESPEELIRDADAAMYAAKQRGRARFELFDEDMRPSTLHRMGMERDLRRALHDGRLWLAYQPVVSLRDGRVTGVEALARWDDPERGTVPPGEFIPLAEASSLIVSLGNWVLEEACRQGAAWQDARAERLPLSVSVNVSARQFALGNLEQAVRSALERSGLPPEALVLELTESALLDESQVTAEVIPAIKRLGVSLALDDFGTGYSSLGYLQRFPLDALKIDRSFVARLNGESSPIVEAVLGMAEALGMDVVGEGVETRSQLDRLRELGCQQAQGFELAPPAPAREIEPLLRRALI